MTLTATLDAPALDFGAARQAMIDGQLRPNGINDHRLLAMFARVPREDHVPAAARGHAYIDRAIALDATHSLPAPLVQARLIAEAAPTAADKALLVSPAGSYLAALLGPLVGGLTVVTPAEAASTPGGDYTVLVIEGAIEELPDALTAKLAEGARIATGTIARGVSRLARGARLNGAVLLEPVIEMGIPALPEFAAPRRWSF